VSSFGEVNVRTYALGPDGEPGVWFFSLDASGRLAVVAARLLYGLRYVHARVRLRRDGPALDFTSERRRGPGHCHVRWRPGDGVHRAAPGSRDEFLVERYTLFARRGTDLVRARVRHEPYPLRPVELLGLDEDLLRQAGIARPDEPPLALASDGVDPDVTAPERVASGLG
jgi:hypothetical protein